ncbi:MAG: beta-propeller domain-containing protein, partial [Eubacterium sp.]|nr:beta-propeller domain-containing protein [Eubacterium sp.]
MNEEEIYDEIKNKAADIEVPESLSPENVEKKLQGVKQVTTPKKSTFGVLTALAASFAVMLIAGLAAFAVIKHQSAGYEPQNEGVLAENPSGNGAQSQAGAPEMTYEEICKMINSYNEENNRRYSDMEKGVDYAVPEEVPAAGEESADTAPAPAADSSANGNGESNNFKSMGNSAAGDYSKTDEQVEGVAEGDIVKTDGTYIYTVDNNSMTGYKIRIIKADGKNSEEISSINGSELNCREMY